MLKLITVSYVITKLSLMPCQWIKSLAKRQVKLQFGDYWIEFDVSIPLKLQLYWNKSWIQHFVWMECELRSLFTRKYIWEVNLCSAHKILMISKALLNWTYFKWISWCCDGFVHYCRASVSDARTRSRFVRHYAFNNHKLILLANLSHDPNEFQLKLLPRMFPVIS